MQPRPDEFGPFLTESLQGCAQLRVLLHELRKIKKRHGIRELAGIVVTRWLVCHFAPRRILDLRLTRLWLVYTLVTGVIVISLVLALLALVTVLGARP